VGAQAVYLQTGDAGLSVAPFTRDGDVALDPGPLLAAESPLLGEVMAAAGFALRINTHGGIDPGTWMKTTTVGAAEFSVPVDLIIPLGALLAPGKTRGARLGAHGKTAAMQTRGLEAALVDRQVLTVQGLAPGDTRSAAVAVAGVGALLVAKVIKLQERVAGARLDRQRDKDAGDIYRLIRTTPVEAMAARLAGLRRDHLAGAITTEAVAGCHHHQQEPVATPGEERTQDNGTHQRGERCGPAPQQCRATASGGVVGEPAPVRRLCHQCRGNLVGRAVRQIRKPLGCCSNPQFLHQHLLIVT